VENFTISAPILGNVAKKAVKAHHSFIHLLWMIQEKGSFLFQKPFKELATSLKIKTCLQF